MPSGITSQITKADLIEQLEQMKLGGVVEIITGDYIERYEDDGYTLNEDDHFFNRQDLVDMIYSANRIYFIDVPEESFIKGLNLGINTGGNIMCDFIRLKNGQVICISGEVIALYKNEEDANNNEDNIIGEILRMQE